MTQGENKEVRRVSSFEWKKKGIHRRMTDSYSNEGNQADSATPNGPCTKPNEGRPNLKCTAAVDKPTKDFQQAETANPVSPSSRTPITGVENNEQIWAEESNLLAMWEALVKTSIYLAFSLTKLSRLRLKHVLVLKVPSLAIASFVTAAKNVLCKGLRETEARASHTVFVGRDRAPILRGPWKGVYRECMGESSRPRKGGKGKAKLSPHCSPEPEA
ncbi:hypothetical protein THAOC_15479 [Thalassiosira oceanica]|uniref:Uncharacterized protein n=1 Tax=Thalassiosira oceanica TaxID=159749 RepID=K0SS11_THAOC|nr:hypothetical protein THAOC_15479 [Thalassiosira oceanica]|eukprot:EJK63841.1 hypothetical protein THAOC_15479 [Thalassiosira oceanica]